MDFVNLFAIPRALGHIHLQIRGCVPELFSPLQLLFVTELHRLLRALKFISSSDFQLVKMFKLPAMLHNWMVAKCRKRKLNYSDVSLLAPCPVYYAAVYANLMWSADSKITLIARN